MKIFVLIFVSLFFVNAHSETDDDKKAANAAAVAALLATQKSEKQLCNDAVDEKFEKIEEIKEKIEEIQKERAEDRKEIQKDINDKDAEIAEADVAYKKARDEIQVEINANEEEKDTTLRTINDKLSKQIQDLKKIIITERNKIERDYQQNLSAAYSQCNIIAQKDLKDRKAADRVEKQAQNKGQIKSGGAGFNGNTNVKIKNEVVKGYKECLAMAEEALKSKRTNALEESKDAETSAQTEITNSNQELTDYVTKKYPKKAMELNEKLNTAGEENTQKKNSLAQQKQALQQALAEKMALFDGQINRRNAELINKKSKKSASEKKEITKQNRDDLVADACCAETTTGYKALAPSAEALCNGLRKSKASKDPAPKTPKPDGGTST